LYTDDAGKNWAPEISSSSGDLNEIRLIGKTIYACGTFGTIIYKDLEK
jgi:hypothetical protein